MTQADGLPDMPQGGHFEFCTGNELVEGLQIHYEVAYPILLRDDKGVSEEPFVPCPSSIVLLDSIVLSSEDIAAS